jgi:hypothetical protein
LCPRAEQLFKETVPRSVYAEFDPLSVLVKGSRERQSVYPDVFFSKSYPEGIMFTAGHYVVKYPKSLGGTQISGFRKLPRTLCTQNLHITALGKKRGLWEKPL